ncbi:filamentous hemagglutinin N-terminal domain-containing protein [Brasilonema sp. CT11]|nr:filamentous hemagglutinin N-terminal domain-containing protein [Brasilonema sp. CT11]
MLRIKLVHHILFFLTLPLATIATLAHITTAVAQQVTPDGTVSTTVITPDGKNFTINDGTTRGGNLFHSFKEFSVPTGGSANFNNAANIQNIINRVTGGSVSSIDGLIKANGAANVFLLNPAGIVFGPNASLNIGGSFLGTTAHSFLFDNGFEFSATNPQAPPLLTINVPIGLRFRDNPQNIVNRSRAVDNSGNIVGLGVRQGNSLTLVGGNVTLDGGVLYAPGGRIEIGSFDSNQVVNLVPVEQGLSLSYQGTPSFRDIQFSKGASANVTADGSGSIAILGRNINFTDKSALLANTLGNQNGGEISIVGDFIGFNNSSITSNTSSSGNGGQIKLDANNIKFENRSGVNIQTSDRGNAGNINVRANSLGIEGGTGFVSTTTGSSTGKAGDINIAVNGPMAIAFAGIQTDSFGTGNAGKININANSLQIDTSGLLSRAFKTDQAGEININVADSLTTNKTGIQTSTYGTADAGKINISANSFQFKGQILSEVGVSSTGRGGEINITAGSLEVLQTPGNSTVISTKTAGIGDAGKININANSFLLERSGVTSSTEGSGTGNAGEINITAGLFKTNNSAYVETNNSGSGNAGDLKVRAKTLDIRQTELGVGNTGNGNAGNLEIVADTIKLDDSSLNANTRGGEGNITVKSGDLILRNNGKITTNATGTANGGNITIDSPLIVAFPLENSDITANAFSGNGGNITIRTQGVFGIQRRSQLTPESDITAFSQQNPSLNGTINIITPDLDPTRGLFELTETVIDPAQQVAQNPCVKGFGSTFTITGRGGLPSDPNKILSSDNVRVDLVEPVPSTVSSTSTTEKKPSQQPSVKKIVPAQGWIYNEKGQVVLVAYDPTKTGPQRSQPAPTSSCAATR